MNHQATFGCVPTVDTGIASLWLAQPAASQGFSVAFSDGTTVSQDPRQTFFVTGGAGGLLWNIQGGHSAFDLQVLTPPDAALNCTSPNSSFCYGAYELVIPYPINGPHLVGTNNVPGTIVTINYYLSTNTNHTAGRLDHHAAAPACF